ncbi:MAG: hypothetical protein JRL30_25985 [Deltaproteobacteria bacterium]|nr:hypothetical protein [Deltaproteobacteria bacterium]
MSDIFGFIPSGVNLVKIAGYVAWFFVFLLFCGAMVTLIIVLLVKSKQRKVIEINMLNKRMRIFNGRTKKKGKGIKAFFANKIGRYLPDFQQQSLYVKGRQDAVVLVKDNNGLYHTARVPTWKELKKWYMVQYEIDLESIEEKDKYARIRDIYLLPSPHEDLDWLSNQCIEADKEFQVNNWWNSPVVAYIATGFICFMMIVITILFRNR